MQDLVQDAVACALERKEEWITADGPDAQILTKIMKGRITHRIADLAASCENKNVSLDVVLDRNPDAQELSTEVHLTSPYGLTPGQLLAEERRQFESQLKARAQLSLKSDPDGLVVFQKMAEGVTQPRIIADDIGKTARDVDNIKKRVSRTLSAEFEDLKEFLPFARRPKADGK